MNLATVDLNLLKAFDALYAERSVTRAGARIGLAQPSMSNALNRLRVLFDDKLFVRTPKGMAPTDRAATLAPKVAAALRQIQDLVEPPAVFDPMTTKAEITLATSDNVNMMLAPRLAAHLARNAPGFDLRFRPLDKTMAFSDLDAGQLDAVIGTFAEIPARFFQRDLFEDEFVCIARKDHPALADGLSVRRFAALPHILMTLSADGRGAVDQALRKLGLERRVALTVGQFIVIPDIVAQTDSLAAIPLSVANVIAARAGCTVYPMPFPVPSWKTTAIWSQSANAMPAKKYAIHALCRLAPGLQPGPSG